MSEKFEIFVNAFTDNFSSIHEKCACGKHYYESGEEDECEEIGVPLKDAIAVGGSVRTITLEGKSYVHDCDCWKEKATAIMKFLDSNRSEIAEYLNNEKKRRLMQAENLATVE